jgi:Ca2+-binding RTX toxin-like protein
MGGMLIVGGADDDISLMTATEAPGIDTFVGGDGTDTLSFNTSSGMVTNLVVNIDVAAGRAVWGADWAPDNPHSTLIIGSGVEVFEGGDAADTITGGTGNDILIGDGGDDIIHGGAGNDVIYGGSADRHDYSHDEFADNNQLFGDDGNDIIHAGSGSTYIEGGAGNDVIYAGERSGNGFDNISNQIYGGDGNDTLSFANLKPGGFVQVDENNVSVYLAVDNRVETDSFGDIETLVGSNGDDRFQKSPASSSRAARATTPIPWATATTPSSAARATMRSISSRPPMSAWTARTGWTAATASTPWT